MRLILSILCTYFTLCMPSYGKETSTAPAAPTNDSTLSLKQAVEFFSQVASRLDREYAEPVDHEKLLEGALSGMLSNLDHNSEYLTPKEFKEIQDNNRGQFGGIGVEMIAEPKQGVRVMGVTEDGPAAKAGLQLNDFILQVNKKSLAFLSSRESMELLRGEPGSLAHLILRRGKGGDVYEVTLKREIIPIKPVKWRLEGKAGYMRISTFNKKTVTALRDAIKEIQEKTHGALKGFVLDLRGNAGGDFVEGLAVADVFMDGGEILSMRNLQTNKTTHFDADPGDATQGLPLVVLIDSGSASASEIVAGALKDSGRAMVVGQKSFGKGSIQTVSSLSNGGALKMTTALFYTPLGAPIQKNGVTPHVLIDQYTDLKKLDESGQLREKDLARALNTPVTKPENAEETPFPTQEEVKPEDIGKLKKYDGLTDGPKDYQLEQALMILNLMSIDDFSKRIATHGRGKAPAPRKV